MDDPRLDDLFSVWLRRHESGETPAPLEVCRECPELAEPLGRLAEAWVAVQGVVQAVNKSDRPTEPEATSVMGAGPTLPLHPPIVAGYEVLRELGRGGMGIVYLARQLSIGRVVALKVVVHARVGGTAHARLPREAETVGRLQHPHIVQVHDSGTHEGTPWMALEYLPGGTLGAKAAGVPQVPTWAARIVSAIARGIGVAHAAGVVHRDLKPSNVLFAADDQPKVVDFGIAKDRESGLTATGDILGTPSYMAPEQADGRIRTVGPEADVWALGAILYELLTGRPPFKGASSWETVQHVLTVEAVPPRRLTPSVPKDLETVCMKCLRKEPGRRYANASELADDLERFLDGQPVLARPVGAIERGYRLARRHPGRVALWSTAIGSLALTIALIVWHQFSEVETRAEYERQRRQEIAVDAERARKQAREMLALNQKLRLEQVRQRSAGLSAGWATANLADLREIARLGPTPDLLPILRSEAATALSALDLAPAGRLADGFPTYAVAFSPDGQWLAIAGSTSVTQKCRVRLYEADGPGWRERPELVVPVQSGALAFHWMGRGTGLRSIRFSPDGCWLVAGTRDGRIARWSTDDWTREPLIWSAHASDTKDFTLVGVIDLAFSTDGSTFWSGSGVSVRGWNLAEGKPTGFHVADCRLSVDQPRAVERPIVSGPSGFQAVDPTTGKAIGPAIPSDIRRAAIAPDGRTVALVPPGSETSLRLLDPEARSHPFTVNRRAPIQSADYACLTFDPTGGLLATVEEHEKRVKLWGVAAGLLLAEQPIGDECPRATFNHSGCQLAVATKRGVELFDVPNCVLETIVVGEQRIVGLAASADHDDLLISADEPGLGSAVYRGHAAGELTRVATLPPGHLLPALASDGARIAFGVSGSFDQLQDRSGQRFGKFDMLVDARYGPDGRLWVLEAHRLRSMDDAGQERIVWENSFAIRQEGLVAKSFAIGQSIALIGQREGKVIRVNLESRAVEPMNVLSSSAVGIALSPDGARAIVGGDRGEVKLLDVATGLTSELTSPHRGSIRGAAFGANLLATGGEEGIVQLWTPTGLPFAALKMRGPIRKLSLSRDGSSLLVQVEGERGVRRWQLDELRRRWAELGIAE